MLGEEVTRAAEAEAVASAYHAALDAIAADHLDSHVSVKLTALGLEIDLDLCRSLLATVVADAAARGIFVRIDMEHSAVHGRRPCASTASCASRAATTSGSCCRSRLRRTLADVDELADLRPNVRLCKGIYVEPATIAFTGREQSAETSWSCSTRSSRPGVVWRSPRTTSGSLERALER